jgi:hypothetical protein
MTSSTGFAYEINNALFGLMESASIKGTWKSEDTRFGSWAMFIKGLKEL